MIKGIIQNEKAVVDEASLQQTNFNRLKQNLNQKTKNENEIKKERHIMKKKFMESKVQPGAHQNIAKMSDFYQEKKPEHLQFFGTTDCKIQENHFVANTNFNVGPGSYNLYQNSFRRTEKRASTAGFAGEKRDLTHNWNNNPGPQHYFGPGSCSLNGFTAKSWWTNIGAFGTTEKKFAAPTLK